MTRFIIICFQVLLQVLSQPLLLLPEAIKINQQNSKLKHSLIKCTYDLAEGGRLIMVSKPTLLREPGLQFTFQHTIILKISIIMVMLILFNLLY